MPEPVHAPFRDTKLFQQRVKPPTEHIAFLQKRLMQKTTLYGFDAQ